MSEPQFYLMRDRLYLHWTGIVFTEDEEGAWLGTADHVTAFRHHHALASARGVHVVSRVVPEPVVAPSLSEAS